MALSAYAVDEKYGFSKDDFQWATAKVESPFCYYATFIYLFLPLLY